MKKARFWSTVTAVVLGVALAAPPANAAPAGFNDKITPVRSVGSDTTYFLMQPLSDLFNQSPGCKIKLSNFSECDTSQPATVVTTENYDHDEVTQAAPYDVGSGNGIKQLCGTTVPLAPLKAHMARSSRSRGTAACEVASNNQTFFKGFARDGLDVLVFPSTTAGSQGSPAAGCKPGELPPGCTGVFKSGGTRRFSKQNLIAIFSSGTVNDWCQLNNGTIQAGDGNDPQDNTPVYFSTCATPQPIYTWRVNPGSGTKPSWDTFLGVADSNATADFPPGGSDFIQENNAQPIKDAGAAIQQNTVFYGSNARFSALPFTRADGGTVPINNGAGTSYVAPNLSTISGGSYPAVRTLYNVTLNTANPPAGVTPEDGHTAAQAFVNWLCQLDHATSDESGNNYNVDLQKAFEKLFFVRLGGKNTAGTSNTPCTNE